jgi:hypothetical protein
MRASSAPAAKQLDPLNRTGTQLRRVSRNPHFSGPLDMRNATV